MELGRGHGECSQNQHTLRLQGATKQYHTLKKQGSSYVHQSVVFVDNYLDR